MLPARLLVITDRFQVPHSLEATVQSLAQNGLLWLMLRERDLDVPTRSTYAQCFAALASQKGFSLSIGGDPDLALKWGTQRGLHLQHGSDLSPARALLGPQALIGLSVHSLEDIQAVEGSSLDYMILSPIFPSPSKPGYGPPLGLDLLEKAARLTSIPLFALGGITPERATACLAVGAYGCAVMGDLMRPLHPAENLRAYLEVLA